MDDLIYHYTSENTFKSMMQSKSIWLTDLRKMNDDTEYILGFKIISEYIREFFPILSEEVAKLSPENMGDDFMILISSFSLSGDSLGMWRGYGDFGSGISFGVEHADMSMINLVNRYVEKGGPVFGKVMFFGVIYNEDNFKECLRGYLEHISNQYSKNDKVHQSMAIGKLKSVVVRLSSLYKHHGYYDEQEFRGLIEVMGKNDPYKILERSTSFGEAKYYKMDLAVGDYMPVKKVVLGPKNKTTINDMQEYLKSININGVDVIKSEIPFR